MNAKLTHMSHTHTNAHTHTTNNKLRRAWSARSSEIHSHYVLNPKIPHSVMNYALLCPAVVHSHHSISPWTSGTFQSAKWSMIWSPWVVCILNSFRISCCSVLRTSLGIVVAMCSAACCLAPCEHHLNDRTIGTMGIIRNKPFFSDLIRLVGIPS